jgi:predicted nucleotidyltransferase
VNQLREIVGLVGGVLGQDVIGTYLHGSSGLGGLRPAGDVDALVVSRRRVDERDRRTLLDGLLRISGDRNRAHPVELAVVVRSEVWPWRYPPTGDFLYGEWLRAAYEAGEVPRPEPMPDPALLNHHDADRRPPAHRPRPAQVLDPVPRADLVRASVAGIFSVKFSLLR